MHDSPDPVLDLERRETIAQVSRLVATLPPDKRDLLALRYAADLSIAEIAAITGKSTGATRKQLARILQSLEDHYHDSHS